jgi:tetratricopeptide (TPR) repeat protein
MTERSDRPIVGRRPLVNKLLDIWQSTTSGPQAAILAGSTGTGRRTIVTHFLQAMEEADEAATVFRLHSQAGDEGVRLLLRTYGSVVTGLNRARGFEGDPGDLLTDAGLAADEDRTRESLYGMAASLKELGGRATGNLQIKLPADNPYLGIIHAFDALARHGAWIFDMHDCGHIVSPAWWTFMSVLVGRARANNWRMLFILAPGENIYGEGPEDTKPGPRSFVRALFGDAQPLDPKPLTVENIGEILDETYRPASFPDGLAERIHAMSKGHPETVHEILDALEEDETITWDDKGYSLSDLDDVDLDVLVPIPNEGAEEEEEDEDEDEAAADSPEGEETDEDSPEGEETGAAESRSTEEAPSEEGEEYISVELLERVLHVAAFEGREFTAALVRTCLDAGEDEVDDALDAMPHLVEEGTYHEALGTWTYTFRYAFHRQWYLDNPPEDWKEKPAVTAKKLATIVLQSYAPAAFEYIARAATLYSHAGDSRGARTLLTMAMSTDRAELTQFALELVEKYDDSPWPEPLPRMLFTGYAERYVNGASPEAALTAVERTRTWAEKVEDPVTLAHLHLLECRIAIRNGDFQAARAKGVEALKGFRKAKEASRAGETLNQLAMVALNMRDRKAARDYVKQAGRASTLPPIKSHSLYIDGLLNKGNGKIARAEALFHRSVELSTTSGNLILTLEAMLNAGECSLMISKGAKVVPMLRRALEMSRALRSLPRERVSARLLCQAEAAAGNGDAAFEMAKHALELTREIGTENQEQIDLYHCGLFAVIAEKTEEGLGFLEAAKGAAETAEDGALLVDVLYNIGQIKASSGDLPGARSALEEALGVVRARNDKGRELRVLESLGIVLSSTGDHAGAADRFKEAADRALGPRSKQLRKDLKKRIAHERKLAEAPPADVV